MKEGLKNIDWRIIAITVVVALVTAGAIGGGVWYYMDQQNQKLADDNTKQVDSLQSQIDDLNENSTSAEASTTTATNATAGWKTYSNSNPVFTFKYPTNQTAATPAANDPTVWLSTDGNRSNETLLIVFAKNSATTVQSYYNYVKSNVGLPEPNTVIGNKTINGKDFYQVNMTHMGGAVTELFFVNNGYGYQISYPTGDAILYEQIIGTLTF